MIQYGIKPVFILRKKKSGCQKEYSVLVQEIESGASVASGASNGVGSSGPLKGPGGVQGQSPGLEAFGLLALLEIFFL